jgi:hypothetical protein
MNAWIAAFLLGASLPSMAATAHKVATAPPVRSECVPSIGLCVTVPAAWQRLGNVFQDLGFVAAEPVPGADQATWPQLTVAALDVPALDLPPQGAAAQNNDGGAPVPPSLDSLMDIVLSPDDSFASAQTLQRTRLLLNGADAEIVRVQFRDKDGNPGPIEAVALIQGEDGFVYSIALRCAPHDFDRLEPVFQQTARSWRIQPPSSAPASSPTPKQDSAKP